MKLSRQGKISYLKPDWADANGLLCGFTTRNGGISRPPYNSLNLGFNTDDQRHLVEGNRSNLVRSFEVEPHQLLTIQQVHGSDVLVIDEPNPDVSHFQRVEADAIISNQAGMMFGVLTADCYPVLLWDPRNQVGAAVHVGWRGAAAGILQKTVSSLQNQFGTRAEDLFAAVGPGIGAAHYQVDRPVRSAFTEGSGFWDRIAKEVGLGQWTLDLRESCRLQLDAAGLDARQVDLAEENTVDQKELFFSHRRDQGVTGRQMGFVVLR